MITTYKGVYLNIGPILVHANIAKTGLWANTTTMGEMTHLISLTTTIAPMKNGRLIALIIGPLSLKLGWKT